MACKKPTRNSAGLRSPLKTSFGQRRTSYRAVFYHDEPPIRGRHDSRRSQPGSHWKKIEASWTIRGCSGYPGAKRGLNQLTRPLDRVCPVQLPEGVWRPSLRTISRTSPTTSGGRPASMEFAAPFDSRARGNSNDRRLDEIPFIIMQR